MFQITVKEHSKEEHQPELYEKMNSSKKARNFIKSNTESADEKQVEFGSISSDV